MKIAKESEDGKWQCTCFNNKRKCIVFTYKIILIRFSSPPTVLSLIVVIS